MTRRRKMFAVVGLLLGVIALCEPSWAQDTPVPDSSAPTTPSQPAQPAQSQEPVPAYGQQNGASPINENPPLTGLDVPSLEPHSAPLSYIQPGATISETADSNVDNTVGATGFNSVSRAMGSLLLNRAWSHYNLALDYIGGFAYYDVGSNRIKTLQQMDFEQKITWKRGQFSVRDSFSYLPDGNFGGSFGSLGSQGIGSLGSTYGALTQGSILGALGDAPRLLNISVGEVEQLLTPRSAITATAGYAVLHFYGPDVTTGTPFIGSSEFSGQVGYNRLLSSKTQVAVAYAYEGFDFTVLDSTFHAQVVQFIYGHQITGRMDFMAGAGPQFTELHLPCSFIDVFTAPQDCSINSSGVVVGSIPDQRIGLAAQARLHYKFTKSSVEIDYRRTNTQGSGVFAGAETDLVRLSGYRPISRVWGAGVDVGYSRSSRLQPLSQLQLDTCGGTGQPVCPGTTANVYDTGFAGMFVQRPFGRTLHMFVSYQFNYLNFGQSYCSVLEPTCSHVGHRQVISIGLDWLPRPIRID